MYSLWFIEKTSGGKEMKYLIFLLFPTILLAKETTIREQDESITHIETDRRGTVVYSDDKSVYSAGGDRHQEQVDYSLNKGGKIIDEKK